MTALKHVLRKSKHERRRLFGDFGELRPGARIAFSTVTPSYSITSSKVDYQLVG